MSLHAPNPVPFRLLAAGLLLLLTPWTRAAVFTTKMSSQTVASWDDYIARWERARTTTTPPLDTADGIAIRDLNPTGSNGDKEVPDGYIHHWIAAVTIPDTTVANVRAVLENYRDYATIYTPDVKLASATRQSPGHYKVRLITQQTERFGIRFAFDIRSEVEFHEIGGETRVDSRSTLIRESDSGKAPYTDLLPEGEDHGILWRLNSYWRLRAVGKSVYAECQVISLSRKPLPGMGDQVKSRARASLLRTVKATSDAAASPTSHVWIQPIARKVHTCA